MPKVQNDRIKEAEKLFNDGLAMVEIAKKLGVSDGTVRSWKNRHKWGKNEECNVAKENATLQKRRGGQIGNKGNVNAKPPDVTKHGGYSKVYWDTLDEDEQELIDSMPKDEEQLLIEQIQLFSVRERRIMLAINKYRKSDSPVAFTFSQKSERKRSFDNDEDREEYERRINKKVDAGDRLPGNEFSVFTQTDNKDQIIARLEAELSNVQSKKTKAIEALSKIHLERHKLQGDTSGNDVVRAWTEKVLATRKESQNG